MKEEKMPSHIQGAQFINEDTEPLEWVYPRELDNYELTRKFRSRFRDIKGIIDGDDVRDVVEYGEMWSAAQGCCAFVMQKRGIAIYTIVAADVKDEYLADGEDQESIDYSDFDSEAFNHTAVTLWPYVVDEEVAWMQGISSKEIQLIEEIEPDIV